MKSKMLLICVTIFSLLLSPVYGQSTDEPEIPVVPMAEEESGIEFSNGERRLSSPFQIQVAHTFAGATPYSFAPGAGLHLGYQFSRLIYVGLTSSAFFNGENAWDDEQRYNYEDDDKRYEHDKDRVYGQEGVKESESELDPMHLLEVRVSPWDFGLYFSVGALYRGEQVSTTRFKSEQREVGENTYTTGLEATVAYEEWYGVSTGIGFNYIFDCGLSMGSAMNVALGRQSPEVAVSATSAAVSQDDLDYWQEQIESNESQVPYLFTMSLGYAF
jgi:hypothetical protein